MFNCKLDIKQTADVQCECYFFRILTHLIQYIFRKIERWQNSIRVPRMYSCRFNMFHQPYELNVVSLLMHIYLCFFCSVEEMINQYSVSGKVLEQINNCMLKFLIIYHNAHSLAT